MLKIAFMPIVAITIILTACGGSSYPEDGAVGAPVEPVSQQEGRRVVVMFHGLNGFVNQNILGTQIEYHYGLDKNLSDNGLESSNVIINDDSIVLENPEADVFYLPMVPVTTLDVNSDLAEKYIGEILRQTGAETLAFVGHSMGGLVARQVAPRFAGKVSSVTTVATPNLGTPAGEAVFTASCFPITLQLSDFTIAENDGQLVVSGVPFDGDDRAIEAVQTLISALNEGKSTQEAAYEMFKKGYRVGGLWRERIDVDPLRSKWIQLFRSAEFDQKSIDKVIDLYNEKYISWEGDEFRLWTILLSEYAPPADYLLDKWRNGWCVPLESDQDIRNIKETIRSLSVDAIQIPRKILDGRMNIGLLTEQKRKEYLSLLDFWGAYYDVSVTNAIKHFNESYPEGRPDLPITKDDSRFQSDSVDKFGTRHYSVVISNKGGILPIPDSVIADGFHEAASSMSGVSSNDLVNSVLSQEWNDKIRHLTGLVGFRDDLFLALQEVQNDFLKWYESSRPLTKTQRNKWTATATDLDCIDRKAAKCLFSGPLDTKVARELAAEGLVLEEAVTQLQESEVDLALVVLVKFLKAMEQENGDATLLDVLNMARLYIELVLNGQGNEVFKKVKKVPLAAITSRRQAVLLDYIDNVMVHVEAGDTEALYGVIKEGLSDVMDYYVYRHRGYWNVEPGSLYFHGSASPYVQDFIDSGIETLFSAQDLHKIVEDLGGWAVLRDTPFAQLSFFDSDLQQGAEATYRDGTVAELLNDIRNEEYIASLDITSRISPQIQNILNDIVSRVMMTTDIKSKFWVYLEPFVARLKLFDGVLNDDEEMYNIFESAESDGLVPRASQYHGKVIRDSYGTHLSPINHVAGILYDDTVTDDVMSGVIERVLNER